MSKETKVSGVDLSYKATNVLKPKIDQEENAGTSEAPARKTWQIDVSRETVLRVVEKLKGKAPRA